MAKKRNWMGMLVAMLAMGVVLVACPNDTTTTTTTTTTDEFNLDELLRKYMGPNPQTWGDDEHPEEVDVYFLDHSRFDAFKAELDAGGEYVPDDDHEYEYTRDWEKGKAFARLGKRPEDRVQLTLVNADNSTFDYHYTKDEKASWDKLDELLRKYMVPRPETWGEGDDAEEVDVYFLDYNRFDAFKAELDAGGKYIEYEDNTYSRDWEEGKAFVILGVKLNGKKQKLELRRCNVDNSTSEYRYIKIPNDTTTTDEFNLDELLREYMGPNPQTWGDGDDAEEVDAYFLDHSRFDAFKAELDAGGEYVLEEDDDPEYTRDWDTGKAFARLGKRPEDRVHLTLANADNSTFNYDYTKNEQASGDKLDELLRKYMGPEPQTWGDDEHPEEVDVYFLDHSSFDAFKAELDAGGKYVEYDIHTYNRDWDTGKAFASLGLKPYGETKKLELQRFNVDNSTSEYRYIKIP